MSRSRKTEIAYLKYRMQKRGAGCVFCAFNHESHNQILSTREHFWIVKNLFPYNTWDFLSVEHHIMIVPKRHVDAISHFNKMESDEYTAILAEYDEMDYSSYARARGNSSKTVAHQHTHLLKLGKRHKAIGFYLSRPYINLHR